MIYIEDLLEALNEKTHSMMYGVHQKGQMRNPISSPADRKFIQDVSVRTTEGNRLSVKQAYIARKIIVKYVDLLEERGRLSIQDIVSLCENPVYRNMPYESIEIPREVRYLGNRKLGFRCVYSPQIISKIRALVEDKIGIISTDFPYFNRKHKIWVVEVSQGNIEKVMSIIKKFNFNFDDEAVQFLADCTNSVEENSVAISDNEKIYVVCQNNNLLSLWLEQNLSVQENFDV